MATSNLKRIIRYICPYALTTIMVTMILYIARLICDAGAFHSSRRGGDCANIGLWGYRGSARGTLNDSLRECLRDENRLKEYGLYSILGLDRKTFNC